MRALARSARVVRQRGQPDNLGMTKAARAVLAEALRLEENERAELAAEVLASLDGPSNPDAELAWETEIRRRIEALDAGTVDLEPWDVLKQRIEKEILGR